MVPIAKLVPVNQEINVADRLAAIKRIQKLSCGISLAGLKVKDLTGEGRR